MTGIARTSSQSMTLDSGSARKLTQAASRLSILHDSVMRASSSSLERSSVSLQPGQLRGSSIPELDDINSADNAANKDRRLSDSFVIGAEEQARTSVFSEPRSSFFYSV